jgi:uncharacterized membrane protein
VAVSSLYFYAHFPERVPTHWNFRGEVDGWSSRTVGAFMIPAMLAGMYFLFLGIPYLDPKRERYAEFRKVYHIFKAAIIFILAGIYYIASLNALGYKLPVENWTPIAIGLLFIALGNYFGKIKPNWFMGIRTPWTLSSEEVWNKTHRFGGKMFIFSGLLMMLMPWWPEKWQIGVFIVLMIVAVVLPIVYSYVLFAKERGKK